MSAPVLAPWRALAGALDAAEDAVDMSVQRRLQQLPRAYRGAPGRDLRTEEWQRLQALIRAIDRIVRAWLTAVAESPLTADLPAWWAERATVPSPASLAAVARVLRRTYGPLVRAAAVHPELARERFAERVVLLTQALLVAIERAEALSATRPPSAPRCGAEPDPRTTRVLVARAARNLRGDSAS